MNSKGAWGVNNSNNIAMKNARSLKKMTVIIAKEIKWKRINIVALINTYEIKKSSFIYCLIRF
jgi:hypothetical protein